MSKTPRPIHLIPAAFVLILQFFTFAAGRHLEVSINITQDNGYSAKVKGTIARTVSQEIESLFFMDEYAGINGLLTQRFSPINFYDKHGYLIARKRFTPTDSFTTANVGGFAYIVDLKPLKNAGGAAHVSWVNAGGGVLMLDDLLPQNVGRTAKVKLQLPIGWKVFGADTETEAGVFEVSNVEKSVFYIGSNIREHAVRQGNSFAKFGLSGQWLFTDAEAVEMCDAIFLEYESKIGRLPNAAVRIWIGKFPESIGPGHWEADTRGRSVTLVSSDMPFKAQSIQRLHEQLRHEIFHLWIPNGVNLSGNYDWFYEGFALYQSLKMGVAVNRIRFDDYLDTLSRAHAIDARRAGNASMIEASRNRWGGSNTGVYARGMLVAFLCDIAMLDASKGKRSTTELLREIYSKHGGKAKSVDGNEAILTIMKRYPELTPIAELYVAGAEKLEWRELIKAAGIEADPNGGRLSVPSKLSGRQKDLLDKLGYNSRRKLANGK